MFIPNNLFAGAIIDKETVKPMDNCQLIKKEKHWLVWSRSFSNELGRLAQGIIDIKGTSTIKFISCSQFPKGRMVTYGRIVVDYRPHKSDPDRNRLTVGGDIIDYLMMSSRQHLA